MSSSSLRQVLVGPARAETRALSRAALLEAVGTTVDLARPWPLALAVDWAIDGRDRPAFLAPVSGELLLVACGVAAVALSGCSGLVAAAATRTAESAAEWIGARLRDQAFSHSLRLPLRWHHEVRSGELVARLTADVGRLLDAVVAVTVTLLPGLLTLAGVLALLLLTDPLLAAIGLLVIPVLAVLSTRQRRLVRASQVDARAASGRLTGTLTDLVRNVATVQAFGRADRAEESFGRRNRDLLDRGLRAVDVESRWAPRCDIVMAVGAGLVLVVGGLQVRDGTQTTGHLLVVVAYLRELYAPVRGLTRLSVVLAKATASADRVAEVLRPPVAAPSRPQRDAGDRSAPARVDLVGFHDVTFGYEPGRPVIDGLDLEVRRGETVCVLGPSGSGKSTLLMLLLRLYDIDDGAITLNGADIRDLEVGSLRERIAYVPQDPWLLDASLADNVAFGAPRATRAAVVRACRAAQVEEFAARLPHGIDTQLGEGAVRLSGGQRRRVALARAVVSPAEVLLLDEPTASLDADAARAVARTIRAATRDRTTLIVTHDPMLAEIADRTVVLGLRVQAAVAAPAARPGYAATPVPEPTPT